MRALMALSELPELSAFWLRTSQPAGQPSMPCRVGVVGMVVRTSLTFKVVQKRKERGPGCHFTHNSSGWRAGVIVFCVSWFAFLIEKDGQIV